MSSEFQVERNFPGAYIVRDEHLKAYESLLRARVGSSLECSMDLAFGRSSRADSVSELTDDSLIHSSRIESIELSGSKVDLQARVSFRRSLISPIKIRLSGKRGEVLALETELTSLSKLPRAWYSPIKAPFGQGLALAMLLYVIYLPAMAVMAYDVAALANGGSGAGQWSSLAGSFCAIALGWNLLPSLHFAIGQGLRRWDLIQTIASWLFIGVGTASIVNWATARWTPW